MARFYRADDVFNDLPATVKKKVFRMGAGKPVYFPSNNHRKPVEKTKVCKRYAEGLSFAKVGAEFRISGERAFKIVAEERERFSSDRIGCWRNRGLSLREVARL